MFEMKDEYYIGISQIDEQHKKLFQIADETYELLNNAYIADKYDHIVALLDELKEYTATHFAEEEAYMENIMYKKILSHKVEHQEFLEKINEIELDDLEVNQETIIMDILNFVYDWLVHHILDTDKLIVEVK